jgi:predicted O-methyltransferase YrrM
MPIPITTLPTSGFELSLIATQYRTSSLRKFFVELNEGISMLHPDVLAVLYHFGAYSTGPVLEVGPYIGGSTIAVARGLADARSGLKVTSIEKGGKYDHPNYPTPDIVASLRANLTRYGVASQSNVIVGQSRDDAIVQQVARLSLEARFACFVIDSDGQVEKDIKLYRPTLAPRAYLVVDDYYAPGAPEKEATTRLQIDELERQGIIQSFGVHGWGTWFGRFV